MNPWEGTELSLELRQSKELLLSPEHRWETKAQRRSEDRDKSRTLQLNGSTTVKPDVVLR